MGANKKRLQVFERPASLRGIMAESDRLSWGLGGREGREGREREGEGGRGRGPKYALNKA